MKKQYILKIERLVKVNQFVYINVISMLMLYQLMLQLLFNV